MVGALWDTERKEKYGTWEQKRIGKWEEEETLTSDTNEPTGQERRDIDGRLDGTARPRTHAVHAGDAALVEPVVRVVQPERARDAVRVPAGEQAGGDGDEVGEDGHADGEHERRAVGQHHQQRPRRPAQDCVLVQVARVPEQADEEEFGRRVRVETARDQEVGERDAVLLCPAVSFLWIAHFPAVGDKEDV